ncbi:MAG: efflux RND transporter periplasmic adaptor subunit [Candidatus Coatesbacteria bacterium]|nr:MAG: efflux RND transporter periplasmic adaptor subunit [Candidatus Coatesbacteria bacterium]
MRFFPKKRRKLWIAIIIAVVILAFIGFCVIRNMNAGIPEFRTEEVVKGDITEVVSGPGEVDPRVSVDISANIMGRVSKIYVEEGQSVSEGDILLELEQTEYAAGRDQAWAAYRSAQNNLELAEIRWSAAKDAFERKKELYDQGLISREAYDTAVTAYEMERTQYEVAKNELIRARAALVQAKDVLDKTIYASPIDGVVTALNVEEGEFTVVGTLNTPGTVMLTVSDLAYIEVEAEIDETDVVSVEMGQPAKITVDAFPDEIFKGKVVEIGSSAIEDNLLSVDTGSSADFKVRVLLENATAGLKPGMTATVDVVTGTAKEVLAVPISAIVTRDRETVEEWKKDGNKKKGNEKSDAPKKIKGDVFRKDDVEGVFVVDGGRARFVEVETGLSGEQYIELVKGPEAGAEVITGPYQPLRTLKDGDRIRITKEEMEEE